MIFLVGIQLFSQLLWQKYQVKRCYLHKNIVDLKFKQSEVVLGA
ncbi:hypothetical protein pb186bvf_002405 [Paramecium bursaria]